jgi:ankyrin repeat protein
MFPNAPVTTCELPIGYQADPNIQNTDQHTAIMEAALGNHFATVRSLILIFGAGAGGGINLDIRQSRGQTVWDMGKINLNFNKNSHFFLSEKALFTTVGTCKQTSRC